MFQRDQKQHMQKKFVSNEGYANLTAKLQTCTAKIDQDTILNVKLERK